ncbi:MAG: flagellar biosynthesis anti-sigma factor FlgM [Deltaproteobacteria bacterium]|nr:flagellar biosynthesis anti-sigma factor FlgM [Deltaproteobacteria bacterium]
MISKIKDATSQVIQQYQKSDAVKKENETQLPGMSSTWDEKVDLSAKAKDIQQIKQVIDQTPDVRADKVRELKQKVENGSYQVDSEKIAEKIVTESLIDIIV